MLCQCCDEELAPATTVHLPCMHVMCMACTSDALASERPHCVARVDEGLMCGAGFASADVLEPQQQDTPPPPPPPVKGSPRRQSVVDELSVTIMRLKEELGVDEQDLSGFIHAMDRRLAHLAVRSAAVVTRIDEEYARATATVPVELAAVLEQRRNDLRADALRMFAADTKAVDDERDKLLVARAHVREVLKAMAEASGRSLAQWKLIERRATQLNDLGSKRTRRRPPLQDPISVLFSAHFYRSPDEDRSTAVIRREYIRATAPLYVISGQQAPQQWPHGRLSDLWLAPTGHLLVMDKGTPDWQKYGIHFLGADGLWRGALETSAVLEHESVCFTPAGHVVVGDGNARRVSICTPDGQCVRVVNGMFPHIASYNAQFRVTAADNGNVVVVLASSWVLNADDVVCVVEPLTGAYFYLPPQAEARVLAVAGDVIWMLKSSTREIGILSHLGRFLAPAQQPHAQTMPCPELGSKLNDIRGAAVPPRHVLMWSASECAFALFSQLGELVWHCNSLKALRNGTTAISPTCSFQLLGLRSSYLRYSVDGQVYVVPGVAHRPSLLWPCNEQLCRLTEYKHNAIYDPVSDMLFRAPERMPTDNVAQHIFFDVTSFGDDLLQENIAEEHNNFGFVGFLAQLLEVLRNPYWGKAHSIIFSPRGYVFRLSENCIEVY